MEARCCTGRQVPMAKAPCSRATSLPWCKTAVTSASCEAIQILFRLDPRQYGASSRESNHSHSNRFMEAGGRRTFSQMQKQQLRNLPHVICERSDRSPAESVALFRDELSDTSNTARSISKPTDHQTRAAVFPRCLDDE